MTCPRVILTLYYYDYILIDPVLFVRLKYLYKTVMLYLLRFRLHSRPQLSKVIVNVNYIFCTVL